MDVKRIWKREVKKRSVNDLRRERVNRNWPHHAERAVEVFTSFAAEARRDNVIVTVIKPEWFMSRNHLHERRYGEYPIGETSVSLRLGAQLTGHGIITRTEDGEGSSLQLEKGGELIVHHSPAEGLIQVFFQAPQLDAPDRNSEPLLYTHTYQMDDLTREWLTRLIPPFLAFNRVESILELPNWRDTVMVRWWRFWDIRNRRGYLEKFQHIFTPWELLLIAAVAALPAMALLKGLWGLTKHLS